MTRVASPKTKTARGNPVATITCQKFKIPAVARGFILKLTLPSSLLSSGVTPNRGIFYAKPLGQQLPTWTPKFRFRVSAKNKTRA
mmetsp:Transcript_135394/g.235463  ORF Transcript_135394/g.235463 Transcript_135394/m.235463 type:complete len:85 (+) Transcript_135394:1012-1266(+)